jgi:hypothetical protein
MGTMVALRRSKVRDREVGGSNPLAPTFFRKKPFGENVEGLSHFRDGTCGFKSGFN